MYGDSEVMRHRVGQLREQAVDIRSTADQLVARAEAVAWTGRAADAMRARIHERAVALRATAERTETAAESLESHLQAVDEAKDEIAARERRAQRLLDEGGSFTPPEPEHKDWLTFEIPGQA